VKRLLFVIPHYYRYRAESDLASEREPAQVRAMTLMRTVMSLHQTFNPVLCVRPEHRTVVADRSVVEVKVVTTADDHLMAQIGDVARLVTHVEVDAAPTDLGFAVHRILAAAVGDYAGYGYVEDDLAVHDPLLFDKQRWFTTNFGPGSLLMPNRFEASGGLKVYPDGPLPPEATAGLAQPDGSDRLAGNWFGLDLAFEHPSNPHAGCFFVDGEQMRRLVAHPQFGIPHASFVRKLETAASGLTAETFRVYKPVHPTADFLEVEHQGSHYLGLWATPDPRHIAEAARNAAEAKAMTAETELAAIRASRSWRMTAPVRRVTGLARRRP